MRSHGIYHLVIKTRCRENGPHMKRIDCFMRRKNILDACMARLAPSQTQPQANVERMPQSAHTKLQRGRRLNAFGYSQAYHNMLRKTVNARPRPALGTFN